MALDKQKHTKCSLSAISGAGGQPPLEEKRVKIDIWSLMLRHQLIQILEYSRCYDLVFVWPVLFNRVFGMWNDKYFFVKNGEYDKYGWFVKSWIEIKIYILIWMKAYFIALCFYCIVMYHGFGLRHQVHC